MTGKVFDSNATMLGKKQESWLMANLAQSESTWNVLAQQVMMAPLNRGEGEDRRYSMDQWPGYEISRRRLLKFFHDQKIPNPVVLTGDIHVNWVNDLQLDFEKADSPIVGTELVGTSMTSGGTVASQFANTNEQRHRMTLCNGTIQTAAMYPAKSHRKHGQPISEQHLKLKNLTLRSQLLLPS